MSKQIKAVQDTCLEILKEVIAICNQNNIQYYLVGGSALGAYRHQGFIPWDDDIDIAIPRDQYAEFLRVCKSKLNEKFYLQDYSVDRRFIFPFAKVRINNTAYVDQDLAHIDMHHGIFIDIFPLDNISDSSLGKFIQKNGLKLCNAIRMAKWDIRSISSIKNVVLFFIKYLVPLRLLPLLYSFFMEMVKGQDTKQIGNVVGAYSFEKESIDRDIFGVGKVMMFEGIECIVPEKIEEFLSEIYGENYMELPPESERKTHNPVFISFGEEYSQKGQD